MTVTFTVSDTISELTFTSFIFGFPGPISELSLPYFSAASNSFQTADVQLFTDAGVHHVMSTSDTIAELVLYDHVGGQPMITISGLSVVDSDFKAAISNNTDGIFNYFGLLGLLNGDVVVNGPNVDYPYLEVGGGGGTATVNAGRGNATISLLVIAEIGRSRRLRMIAALSVSTAPAKPANTASRLRSRWRIDDV